MSKHKCFISYHHANDQFYKDSLVRFNAEHDIFLDYSVDLGEIDDSLSDQRIRQIIRDDYLRDTTVTILLVGTGTYGRKHIDWELYSSMIDGSVNKKSGILVVMLPETGCTNFTAAHGDAEKAQVHPDTTSWMTLDKRSEYDNRYPLMPARVIDNLLTHKAKISVVPWSKLNVASLRLLIELTHSDRSSAEYDFSRPMMRRNF